MNNQWITHTKVFERNIQWNNKPQDSYLVWKDEDLYNVILTLASVLSFQKKFYPLLKRYLTSTIKLLIAVV